jgi:hypothetical protein
MRGRKEALWAVAISAALVTAGLTLSCGDEDNGGAAVDCQAACEKLMMCDYEEFFIFGYPAADCIEACEQELAEAKADIREGLAEVFACIPDTDCDNIKGDCFCKPACQKLADCGMLPYYNMADCVYWCDEEISISRIFRCSFGLSSCELVYDCWD